MRGEVVPPADPSLLFELSSESVLETDSFSGGKNEFNKINVVNV